MVVRMMVVMLTVIIIVYYLLLFFRLQINVVHINAVAKNAADDKIRQSLRRFSDSHPPGTRVILISSKSHVRSFHYVFIK